MRMYNPPHPGKVLKGLFLKPAKISATDFAARLGVDRKTISRLINERCGVTAEMALRLAKVLNNSPEMWLGMQQDYDLWHAEQEFKGKLKSLKRYHFKDTDHRPHA